MGRASRSLAWRSAVSPRSSWPTTRPAWSCPSGTASSSRRTRSRPSRPGGSSARSFSRSAPAGPSGSSSPTGSSPKWSRPLTSRSSFPSTSSAKSNGTSATASTTASTTGGPAMIGRLFSGLATVGFLILSTDEGGWAATAQEQLKGAIDRVVSTLDSPAMKGEGKAAERRTAVRKIANEIFDFGEIARRSLGRYWQPLSETQRSEFVGLFGDLLERSYISKIELYGGEKIVYNGERVDGDLAI